MVDQGSCVKHSGMTSEETFFGFLVNWKSGAKEQGMLLILGLEKVGGLPEIVVYVSWLKSGELERMNACIGFKGPWQPPVGMNSLYSIAMWCTTDWENVELFCTGAKGECARGACMSEKKGGCEASGECSVDEGIDEWWMVLLPG